MGREHLLLLLPPPSFWEDPARPHQEFPILSPSCALRTGASDRGRVRRSARARRISPADFARGARAGFAKRSEVQTKKQRRKQVFSRERHSCAYATHPMPHIPCVSPYI